ncbi:MAG: hypothetical protein ACRDQU_04180 [Pseudonocardiaceae bacterium]
MDPSAEPTTAPRRTTITSPHPLAQLLLTWISERDDMNTATNPDSHGLFPGRRGGQPMHPESLAGHLRQLGVPTGSARAAAIRQHVLEMPGPVVADALSYTPSPQPRSSPPR